MPGRDFEFQVPRRGHRLVVTVHADTAETARAKIRRAMGNDLTFSTWTDSTPRRTDRANGRTRA